ncbi:MAG: flagellar basal body rod protein FlgC [Oscillospiraceae bacterium]|nr:flagellar basal body rod protein FlgC [Oscillospiraceae bacterium]
MNIFRAMDISASALTAQRFRMDVVGENIANADTTRTADGSVYRRKSVVFQERPLTFTDHMQVAVSNSGAGAYRTHHYDNTRSFATAPIQNFGYGAPYGRNTYGGVRAVEITESNQPFKTVYDPDHPDADRDGYVTYPNVDIEAEMVNFISATRSYEANITAINNFKNIAMKALDIGR